MELFCIASDSKKSAEVIDIISNSGCKLNFDLSEIDENDEEDPIILVLGGDGFMLRVLHRYINKPYKFYGINTGTIGFLMNQFDPLNFKFKVMNADITKLFPLKMKAIDSKGDRHIALAINEVSLFRATHEAAHLRISINNKEKISELVADGILLSSPAGSSAYNFSAGGPIIPIESNILVLTALNAYSPRRWNSALIPNDSVVEIATLDSSKRPVNVTVDFMEYKNIENVIIYENRDIHINLLFDIDHSLEERLLNEQFK